VKLLGRSSDFGVVVGFSAAAVVRSHGGIARACHFRSLSAVEKCILVGLTFVGVVVRWACNLLDLTPARRNGRFAVAALVVLCSAFAGVGQNDKASLSCTDPFPGATGSARHLVQQREGL
jgi:hypothetical protein